MMELLPEPDSPTKAMCSPGLTVKLKSVTADFLLPGYFNVTFSKVTWPLAFSKWTVPLSSSRGLSIEAKIPFAATDIVTNVELRPAMWRNGSMSNSMAVKNVMKSPIVIQPC